MTRLFFKLLCLAIFSLAAGLTSYAQTAGAIGDLGSHDAGNVYRDAANGTPVQQSLVVPVVNTGQRNVIIDRLVVDGEFFLQTVVALPYTLAGGATLNLTIIFDPLGHSGTKTGKLSLEVTNITGGSDTETVHEATLTGVALAPDMGIVWQ